MTKSTLLPWLFFGPLLVMSLSYSLWSVSGWELAKWLALGCLIWTILFIAVALVTSLVFNRRS